MKIRPGRSRPESAAAIACPICGLLKRKYEEAVRSIYAAICDRSKSVPERIREMRGCQDLRDDKLRAYYEHKKSHPPTPGANERNQRVA